MTYLLTHGSDLQPRCLVWLYILLLGLTCLLLFIYLDLFIYCTIWNILFTQPRCLYFCVFVFAQHCNFCRLYCTSVVVLCSDMCYSTVYNNYANKSKVLISFEQVLCSECRNVQTVYKSSFRDQCVQQLTRRNPAWSLNRESGYSLSPPWCDIITTDTTDLCGPSPCRSNSVW